jgi:hypothetical protein
MEWIIDHRGTIAQLFLWAWIVLTLFQLFYRGPKPWWTMGLNLLLLVIFVYIQWVM